MMVFGFLKQVFKKKTKKREKRKHVKKETKKKVSKGHKTLKDWERLYRELQTHPLTQAKIINEQLLETTNESLKKVNFRLDTIEERLEKIENRKKEIPQEDKINKISIKQLLADPRLSDQERQIIHFIKKQSETDARTVSQKFNISRSNASLKLNKLFSWGLLDKRVDDKTVFFKLKN